MASNATYPRFDTLPDEHRTVLLMRLDGLRIIDIAKRLKTSKSRIGRIVQEGLSLLTARPRS